MASKAILPWHVVVNDGDVAALADVEELLGSLILRDAIRACVLPRLRSITGHLGLEGCAKLVDLRLDRLTHVGCQLAVFGSGLSSFALPALAEIGLALELDGNLALTQVSLPALRSIGASLITDDNPVLESIALPSLESIAITAQRSNCPALRDEEWERIAGLALQPGWPNWSDS